MAGAQEGRHLWADDVEEDELEEARDQQRRGAASPLQASGGRGGGGTNAKDAGVSSSRGSRSTVREELAEEAGYPRFEPRDGWHEGLEVERGASRQRLDLRHGFVREIVRNQRDRDAYERAWRAAHAQGDEYQRKWGRAKVQRDGRDWGTPEPWRSAPKPGEQELLQQQPPPQQQQPESEADRAASWRKPSPKVKPSRILQRAVQQAAADVPPGGPGGEPSPTAVAAGTAGAPLATGAAGQPPPAVVRMQDGSLAVLVPVAPPVAAPPAAEPPQPSASPAKRAPKLREGFAAYRPPPVLTGKGSVPAAELRGLDPVAPRLRDRGRQAGQAAGGRRAARSPQEEAAGATAAPAAARAANGSGGGAKASKDRGSAPAAAVTSAERRQGRSALTVALSAAAADREAAQRPAVAPRAQTPPAAKAGSSGQQELGSSAGQGSPRRKHKRGGRREQQKREKARLREAAAAAAQAEDVDGPPPGIDPPAQRPRAPAQPQPQPGSTPLLGAAAGEEDEASSGGETEWETASETEAALAEAGAEVAALTITVGRGSRQVQAGAGAADAADSQGCSPPSPAAQPGLEVRRLLHSFKDPLESGSARQEYEASKSSGLTVKLSGGADTESRRVVHQAREAGSSPQPASTAVGEGKPPKPAEQQQQEPTSLYAGMTPTQRRAAQRKHAKDRQAAAEATAGVVPRGAVAALKAVVAAAATPDSRAGSKQGRAADRPGAGKQLSAAQSPAEREAASSRAPAGELAPRLQQLQERQRAVLQRVLALEKAAGGLATARATNAGRGAERRKPRSPLVLYQPPRRDG